MTSAIGTWAKPISQAKDIALPSSFSLYLDLVRFLAAMCVFVTHAKYPRFTNGWLDGVGRYGSDAVMIFFVLSGLVIAHVTNKKERNFETYATARLARLWSVALPALLLSFVADFIGRMLYPPIYDGPWYQGDHPALRLFVNAIFQGQIWFVNVLPFTNTPYWSLGYEFWYYAIFAAGIFLRGRKRLVVLTASFLFCGPGIIILLPVWLLGVGVYHFMQVRRISIKFGWVLWIGSFITYGIYQYIGMPGYLLWRSVQWFGEHFIIIQLGWSKDFISNYFVGLLVAANFVGFWRVCGSFDALLQRLNIPIRFLASFTFSVYLFHMPLLHFFSALIRHDPTNAFDQTFILFSSFASALLLGTITEHKKSQTKIIIVAIKRVFFSKSK